MSGHGGARSGSGRPSNASKQETVKNKKILTYFKPLGNALKDLGKSEKGKKGKEKATVGHDSPGQSIELWPT